MERRAFLKIAGFAGAGVLAGGLGAKMLFEHKTSHQPLAKRTVRLVTLEEARAELISLQQYAHQLSVANEWTLYQNLVHCAQSIEYSMTGYPGMKSALFQATLGKWAYSRFDEQQYMAHNLNEPIPQAPPIPQTGNTADGFQRLFAALDSFERFDEKALRPHFAYGALSKKDYAKAHSMHLADHFSAIYKG
jgi:hypothetical protein